MSLSTMLITMLVIMSDVMIPRSSLDICGLSVLGENMSSSHNWAQNVVTSILSFPYTLQDFLLSHRDNA